MTFAQRKKAVEKLIDRVYGVVDPPTWSGRSVTFKDIYGNVRRIEFALELAKSDVDGLASLATYVRGLAASAEVNARMTKGDPAPADINDADGDDDVDDDEYVVRRKRRTRSKTTKRQSKSTLPAPSGAEANNFVAAARIQDL